MTPASAAQATLILQREWLMIVPVLAALFVPGLGAGVVVARRMRLSLAHAVSIAFAFAVALIALLAIVSYYAGWSLVVVAWGYLAAAPASLALIVFEAVRARRDRRVRSAEDRAGSDGPDRRFAIGWQGFVLGTAAALTAAWQQPWWFGTPDGLFHIAATRSILMANQPIVTDPFFGTASKIPDSTAGMWNTVQAVVARVIGVDPASAYLGLTAVSAFAVVLAFWVLACEVGASRWAATWATLAYFSFAWYTDFRAFAYPNKVSIALAFVTIALCVRIATRPSRLAVGTAGVTGFATLAVHLASGELVLLCGAAIAIVLGVGAFFVRDGTERTRWRSGALATAAALGLAVLLELPTLWPRVMALKGSPVVGEDSFLYAGGDLVRVFGMRFVVPGGFGFGGVWLFWLTFAVGVVAIVIVLKSGSRRAAAVLPLIGLVHVLTLFPLVSTPALGFSSYMVARMVELLRFSPYLALAWAWGRMPGRMRPWARVLGAALLVAAIATQWGYIVSTYRQGEGWPRRGYIFSVADAQERDIRKAWGFDALFKMREIFGNEYPLVIAEPLTGYHLMGLENVAVVASLPTHTPVFMPRAEVRQREMDMQWFFNEHATQADRIEIMDAYPAARYVFVWKPYSGQVTTRAIQAMPALKKLIDTPVVTLLEIER